MWFFCQLFKCKTTRSKNTPLDLSDLANLSECPLSRLKAKLKLNLNNLSQTVYFFQI